MSFKDQPWESRFAKMGDEAEAAFEEWATEHHIGYARYGLLRPAIKVSALPTFIRYTPDFLTSGHLIEVQGFGRDQLFKLKVDKFAALADWNVFHPVSLFAWDSTNERHFVVPLEGVAEAIYHGTVEMGSFAEGKEYYEFPAEMLADLETF